jgi:hypothetical protein
LAGGGFDDAGGFGGAHLGGFGSGIEVLTGGSGYFGESFGCTGEGFAAAAKGTIGSAKRPVGHGGNDEGDAYGG